MNSEMHQEAEVLADAVADYLYPHRRRLEGYNWPMTDRAVKAASALGFDVVGAVGGLAQTHALRRAVAARVREVHTGGGDGVPAQLARYCAFVIKDWGELRANKPDTIQRYVTAYTASRLPDLDSIGSHAQLAAATGCAFPFEGIASWSKWLNFVWKDWALIYDARIAFALNAILYMRATDVRAMPVPAGRAALLSMFDSQMLASLRYLGARGIAPPDDAGSNAEFAGWLRRAVIPRDAVYTYYLAAMEAVRKRIGYRGDHALVETEMLLFYLSERDIARDLMRSLYDLNANSRGKGVLAPDRVAASAAGPASHVTIRGLVLARCDTTRAQDRQHVQRHHQHRR